MTMCDERERLIGYVYDECDADERREISQHLGTCDTCRHEIAGLKSVRQDLLAWDVPEPKAVWHPFVQPRVAPSWRDVPAWALATAASVMFAIGAAGGVVTHLWLTRTPVAAAVTAQTTTPAAATLVPVSQPSAPAVNPADLDALEQRLYRRLHAEMDQQVRLVSTHGASMARQEDLAAEVRALRTFQQDQTNFNLQFSRDIGDAFQRINDQGRRMSLQNASLQPGR